MLRHISRTLILPDGKLAHEIAIEGDAERIAADLLREAEGIRGARLQHARAM